MSGKEGMTRLHRLPIGNNSKYGREFGTFGGVKYGGGPENEGKKGARPLPGDAKPKNTRIPIGSKK